jgi:hypothetical protein
MPKQMQTNAGNRSRASEPWASWRRVSGLHTTRRWHQHTQYLEEANVQNFSQTNPPNSK